MQNLTLAEFGKLKLDVDEDLLVHETEACVNLGALEVAEASCCGHVSGYRLALLDVRSSLQADRAD